jgi:hypothetical protein
MQIEMNEKDHIYSVNGDIANISVTGLLHEEGLAPDYSGVNKGVLRRASEEGKDIHKELENLINTKKYEPITPQGANFKKWSNENIDCAVAEQKLAYIRGGKIFAGTADILGYLKDGTLFIGDHKNTANFNKEYVSWEVSLYDYFAKQLKGQEVNGKQINWKGATKFYCFQYDKENGNLEPIELEKVPDTEIERLLDCYIAGVKYTRPKLELEKAFEKDLITETNAFSELEERYKTAKEKYETFKTTLKEKMEEQKIYKWEYDGEDKKISITLVPSYEKIMIDTEKLKTTSPELYSKFSKVSKVASSLKISIKAKASKETDKDKGGD